MAEKVGGGGRHGRKTVNPNRPNVEYQVHVVVYHIISARLPMAVGKFAALRGPRAERILSNARN